MSFFLLQAAWTNSTLDMAVYFDYRVPTRYQGCHDLIEWHKMYCLLAVSIYRSATNYAAVEFYKDEVSIMYRAWYFYKYLLASKEMPDCVDDIVCRLD